MPRPFRNIHEAFGYFTECNLATLERLQDRKSTPKSDLERQKGIADDMVDACRRFGVEPSRRFSTPATPRLNELLAAVKPGEAAD